jgi:membrane protein YqaA with SNARE-associated domain
MGVEQFRIRVVKLARTISGSVSRRRDPVCYTGQFLQGVGRVFGGIVQDVKPVKLPEWLQKFVAVMGGGGLLVVAFLDSSILSFPFVTDALVIELTVQNPPRMVYYAAMAVIGSLAGCIWIYLLAKKGGEAFFRLRAGVHAERTKRWVDQNAFVTMFVSSILPPPLPLFKVVVLAEGVFQVPMGTFVGALLLGRGVRFFGEGIFALRYGPAALVFLQAHRVSFAVWGLVVLAMLYAGSQLYLKHSPMKR